MKYFNFILAATIVAETCSAGNFPADGWGSSYLKDIPKAIAYVEAHASELTVDPPPEDDSDQTLSEIAYLNRIAENRSAKDIIQITKEHLDPYKQFFVALNIDQSDYPKLNQLIHRISRESYLPVLYFKHKFSRTRPYQIDSNLSTVIDGPPHASYPSGHATQGYLFSMILSEILAEGDPRIARLKELGEGIGTRREIAGVHYPSDTKAGVNLAEQLKAWLMKKPEFRDAFNSAKLEFNSREQ